jgi:hypothetical protein
MIIFEHFEQQFSLLYVCDAKIQFPALIDCNQIWQGFKTAAAEQKL